MLTMHIAADGKLRPRAVKELAKVETRSSLGAFHVPGPRPSAFTEVVKFNLCHNPPSTHFTDGKAEAPGGMELSPGCLSGGALTFSMPWLPRFQCHELRGDPCPPA